ncbi:2735_t:CDS:2 [Acaulospora morrowiae]|uniref:2735_t:CDS:1 n=1 Tax=Acaulospora morrowiae TaxID=94023 RepID=A0A9N9HPY2_9GLOM|nr:2735_t:CDS:2 [Acaulospora morrowiae]
MARLVSQGACMLSRGTISSRCCYEIFDGIDPIARISEDHGFVKIKRLTVQRQSLRDMEFLSSMQITWIRAYMGLESSSNQKCSQMCFLFFPMVLERMHLLSNTKLVVRQTFQVALLTDVRSDPG